MNSLGATTWAVAEGYIPGSSTGPEPQMLSHETVCRLNTGDEDAHVEITVFLTDAERLGPGQLTVPARRAVHQRFNHLRDPEVPRGETSYVSVIRSDRPVVAQHTRLDSRQAENALLTTIAYLA